MKFVSFFLVSPVHLFFHSRRRRHEGTRGIWVIGSAIARKRERRRPKALECHDRSTWSAFSLRSTARTFCKPSSAVFRCEFQSSCGNLSKCSSVSVFKIFQICTKRIFFVKYFKRNLKRLRVDFSNYREPRRNQLATLFADPRASSAVTIINFETSSIIVWVLRDRSRNGMCNWLGMQELDWCRQSSNKLCTIVYWVFDIIQVLLVECRVDF